MESERLNAAIAEMAKQDITFANCDSTWQKRVMTAVLAAADTRPAPFFPPIHQEATVMASEYCKFPHCECSMGAAERCKRIRTRPAPMMRALKIVRETNDKGRQALKAWADSKTGPAPADLKAADRKHYKLIRKSLQNKGLLPAATDTGLVTVGNITEECLLELKQMLCGEIHPCNDIGDVTDAYIELVTRSQAVELLAAKDKTIALAETTMIEMHQDLNKLEAELAAERAEKEELDAECRVLAKRCIEKDARIKELEADVKREAQLSTHNAQDCLDEQLRAEALEAKLAAAEKALEPFAAHANYQAVDDTGWRDKETVKIVVSIGDLRKARAVLGGKP